MQNIQGYQTKIQQNLDYINQQQYQIIFESQDSDQNVEQNNKISFAGHTLDKKESVNFELLVSCIMFSHRHLSHNIKKSNEQCKKAINTVNISLTKNIAQVQDFAYSTNQKIDKVHRTLNTKIDQVQRNLKTKIDQVYQNLKSKIDKNNEILINKIQAKIEQKIEKNFDQIIDKKVDKIFSQKIDLKIKQRFKYIEDKMKYQINSTKEYFSERLAKVDKRLDKKFQDFDKKVQNLDKKIYLIYNLLDQIRNQIIEPENRKESFVRASSSLLKRQQSKDSLSIKNLLAKKLQNSIEVDSNLFKPKSVSLNKSQIIKKSIVDFKDNTSGNSGQISPYLAYGNYSKKYQSWKQYRDLKKQLQDKRKNIN